MQKEYFNSINFLSTYTLKQFQFISMTMNEVTMFKPFLPQFCPPAIMTTSIWF